MCDFAAAAVQCQSAKADIVFVVDSSRSICGSDSSCSNWQSVLGFVNAVINQLNIGSANTRVGFVRFSSQAATTNSFYLNTNQDRTRLTQAVSAVAYNTGRQFVGDLANALIVARTEQFVSNRGDRVGVPNIVVVLMNGGIFASAPNVSLPFTYSYLYLFIVYS